MARGGRDGISARISLDGGEEVKRQLTDLGKEGEKALRDLSAATAGASTGLAAVSNVARDLQLVFGRMGGLGAGGGGFSAIASAAAGMTTAVGTTIAVVAAASAALLALAVSGAHAASEIKEGAIRVGVAADDYTKLKFAFEQSGSSAEGFEKAMAIILDAANDAAEAAKKSAEDIEKANEKIKQSSIAAAAEVALRARAVAQEIRGVSRSLATDLANIAIDQGRATSALTGSLANDLAKIAIDQGRATSALGEKLTEREALEKRFAERREDAIRAAAEKQADIDANAAQKRADAIRAAAEKRADIEEKAAVAAREARIKRNKEQQDELDAFNKALTDSTNKSSTAFEKLGVSLLNPDGTVRDPAGAFKDIAEAVSKIEDPAKRAAAAIDMFKRRVGGQLVEALSEGKVGIEVLSAEAVRLGLKFDDADLEDRQEVSGHPRQARQHGRGNLGQGRSRICWDV